MRPKKFIEDFINSFVTRRKKRYVQYVGATVSEQSPMLSRVSEQSPMLGTVSEQFPDASTVSEQSPMLGTVSE